MYIAIEAGRLVIEFGEDSMGTFALDDVEGAATFLAALKNRDDGGATYSSSCDAPELFGAPKGWKFEPHMDRVIARAMVLIEG
jgi:hypothetical protein